MFEETCFTFETADQSNIQYGIWKGFFTQLFLLILFEKKNNNNTEKQNFKWLKRHFSLILVVREIPTGPCYLWPNVAWLKASKIYQSGFWFDQVSENTHMMYFKLAKPHFGEECCKLLLIKKEKNQQRKGKIITTRTRVIKH